MIQFNLLPDIKLQYIKAKRLKWLVTIVSLGIAGTTLSFMLLLFIGVNGLQKKHLSDLNKDITSSSKKLASIPDLNKILTIQNQLQSLPALYDQRPVATRLFSDLSKITPANVSIAKIDVDFTTFKIAISGSADSLETINKFIDTLKFTSYTSDTATSETKAFSNIVLGSFAKTAKDASYQVSLDYDEAIFDSASDVKLNVPKLITSRSETEKPTALFRPQTPTTKEGN